MDKKEKEKKTFWQELPEYIVIMAVTVLVCTCVICFNKIPSGSMEPTIHVGARTVSWRLPYLIGDPAPDHSDIVVFHSPDENKLLIKRVIGLPGDEIKFVNGAVYVNGEKRTQAYEVPTFAPQETYHVPDGCMFVMGDNRSNSKDSRYMDTTFIPIENIYAKFIFAIQLPR